MFPVEFRTEVNHKETRLKHRNKQENTERTVNYYIPEIRDVNPGGPGPPNILLRMPIR